MIEELDRECVQVEEKEKTKVMFNKHAQIEKNSHLVLILETVND